MKIIENTNNELSFGRYFREFNIQGCNDIYKAKVKHGIEVGENFNIYCGESLKSDLCLWVGDLKNSLINHLYFKRSVL